tara:strand:- start:385 stop:1245 length:861 start_codon:yes stop_codon:yes gene_type:complete
MSYIRYAGDRFAGPTGNPTGFPLDVADGAVLFTSGANQADQALYVKVTGSWQQVVQTGVVLETMTGNLIDNNQDQNISGSKVFFDAATFNDLVTINNLTVTGTQTILNTVDSSIKDNLIVLNSGETSAGITLQSGGILIDRGSATDATILFDETLTGENYTGAFNFNFLPHVTGDRLVKSSETGIFQTVINSVHETGRSTNSSTNSFLLTGITSIFDIDGVTSGEAASVQRQQIQCYAGGVLQMPYQYSLSNALGGTGNPTVTFNENLFSGVNVNFVYSASVRVTD